MPVNRRARAIAVGSVLALTVALFSLEYTVKRGDTLSEIARDHDVSLSDVIELNELSNPDLIRPGQVILIPGVDGSVEQVHVVSQGETLAKIASTYGATASAIAEANSMANPDLIRPGQEILIPTTRRSHRARATRAATDGESASSRSGRFHIVQRGETLDSIAGQYSGVSPDTIAAANGITNGKVYTGTRLFLDGPAFVGTGSGGSANYVVQTGDRLGDIAAKYGTNISTLADLNGLSDVNMIRSGQTLAVPGGSSWVCPVEGGRYFNDWGFPRGGSRFHEGNDIFAGKGSPVQGTGLGHGRAHRGDGWRAPVQSAWEVTGSSTSAPTSMRRVRPARSSAGDVIGYVGTSGNARGANPHLHFGMYGDGGAMNPHPTLVSNGC